MWSHKPEDVGLRVCDHHEASDYDALDWADRVVSCAPRGFKTREQILALAETKPVVWNHGIMSRNYGLKWVIDHSAVYVTLSELNWRVDSEWVDPERVVYIPSPLDLKLLDRLNAQQGPRFTQGLWAHRRVAHKGLDLAVDWSKESGIPLKVMTNCPRLQVLSEMTRSSHFVLLSKIVDTCPRSVMEAQLLGCEIVKNQLVGGWFDGSLRERVETAPEKFWNLVCELD